MHASLADYQEWARERSGLCLMTSINDEPRWRCAEGHQWIAEPESIEKGAWCTTCLSSDLQKMAYKAGGRCLSTKQASDDAILSWQCAKGHRWEAKASRVRQGHWCVHCRPRKRRKITIEFIQALAREKGGLCLSPKFHNTDTKMLFQCAKGHQWKTTPNQLIYRKTWCYHCSPSKKLTLKHMHAVAKSRGGLCLSDKYVNAQEKLTWQCQEGHQWETSPTCVIHKNTWCPICAGTTKLTLEQIKHFASSKQGLCLSHTYEKNDAKLDWQCALGHRWRSTVNCVMNKGAWCPHCAGSIKLTLEEAHHFAQEKNGHCLSSVYENKVRYLLWQCAQGHQWEAPIARIKSGSWCLVCSGRAKKTLADLAHMAQQKGGSCLSTTYINSLASYEWRCGSGHTWIMSYQSVKNGAWCPTCRRQAHKA